MNSTVALTLITIITYLFYALVKLIYINRWHWTPNCLKCINAIPGPKGIFPIGNLLEYTGSEEHIFHVISETAKNFPKIFKLWIGNRSAIFLTDPEYIENILTSNHNIAKGELYNFLAFWLHDGLLISNGDKWKSRRKLLTPAFHFNILKQFVPVFERNSLNAIEDIGAECEKKSSDVMPITFQHALHSICETTMGIEIGGRAKAVKDYQNAIHLFGKIMVYRNFRPWLWCDWILYHCSGPGKLLVGALNTLHNFTKTVIQNRLDTWDENISTFNIESASGKKKLPMLDILIAEMKQTGSIDYNGICEEVDTFMFEGHDTTAMALSFLLMLLANHPEIQEKIFEEQQLIMANKKIATYDDLQLMVYLERCIKESLRLYPSVPIIIRRLVEDVDLGKYTLPDRGQVYIGIYWLHRNPNIWPNPEKYDPDRFLPENSVHRHPFAYIPFSAGPRNCIGQRFAMLEMKSFVSKVVKDYILEAVDTPDTIQIKADLVIRPTKDIRVKFRRRI